MATTTAQQRLDALRKLKASGAKRIDRRGMVELRDLSEINAIIDDLEEEVTGEAHPGRVRTRRVVLTGTRGW